MTFSQTDSNKLMEAFSFHRLVDVKDESLSCSSPLTVCLDCLSHALLTKDKASLSGKLSPHALAVRATIKKEQSQPRWDIFKSRTHTCIIIMKGMGAVCLSEQT